MAALVLCADIPRGAERLQASVPIPSFGSEHMVLAIDRTQAKTHAELVQVLDAIEHALADENLMTPLTR